jgi:RNA polymerase sigma-70 factor (ECF subfamily)
VSPAQARLRLVNADTPEDDGPIDLDLAYRRFAGYVATIGLRLLGRRADVDDLVQDVFVAATKGLKNLRDRRATKAWLATVAVRIARAKLRRRRVKIMFSLDEDPDYYDAADERASPETRVLLAKVYAILDHLPVDERLAWSLRYIEGEQLDHVALLCGCSLATVKRRIERAEVTIRKEMSSG